MIINEERNDCLPGGDKCIDLKLQNMSQKLLYIFPSMLMLILINCGVEEGEEERHLCYYV